MCLLYNGQCRQRTHSIMSISFLFSVPSRAVAGTGAVGILAAGSFVVRVSAARRHRCCGSLNSKLFCCAGLSSTFGGRQRC